MKKICMILIGVLGLVSCSDWLDVQPKTAIPGDKLFETEEGFKDALTGFYIKMGDVGLYGKELSYGYLEVLSCNYDNYPDYSTIQWKPRIYEYDNLFLDKKDGIYLKMYNIIVNINNFLTYIEKNRSVIKTKHYYEVMKAEALGLRAFLHFDLLRLFGPVYRANPTAKSIAYRTTFDRDATPLLPANRVVDLVIQDLLVADSLLEEHDTRFFRKNWEREDLPEYNVFLDRREVRMNVYAVKAMLARVYCYKGDDESKMKAVEYANEVIDAPYFELYKNANSFLYEEQIFGLNIFEFDKIITEHFNTAIDYTSAGNHFCIEKSRFEKMYEWGEGGNSDWRSSTPCFKEKDDGKKYEYCRKYEQDNLGEETGKDMLALIRLPEMYYIVAECGDVAASADALNTVRWARGISYDDEIIADAHYDALDSRPGYDQTQSFRVNELMKEYRKEFFAEGKLFYFYKLHNYITYDGAPLKDVRDKYKWPVPDNEIIFGNNN